MTPPPRLDDLRCEPLWVAKKAIFRPFYWICINIFPYPKIISLIANDMIVKGCLPYSKCRLDEMYLLGNICLVMANYQREFCTGMIDCNHCVDVIGHNDIFFNRNIGKMLGYF